MRNRILIGVGCVVLAANLLVVPYKSQYGAQLGYSLIWAPLRYDPWNGRRITASQSRDSGVAGDIDLSRVALQSAAIILLVAAGGAFGSRSRSPSRQP